MPRSLLSKHVNRMMAAGSPAFVNYPAWTADSVREQLPDVRCLFDGREYPGTVRGRKLEFAQVHINNGPLHCEFTWSAIAHSLNRNAPLNME